MKNPAISNEELVSIIKARLGQKSKLDIANDVIYEEYLEMCHAGMKDALRYIVLGNAYIVQGLRELAEECAKIEAPQGKKIKRIPILNSILGQIKFIAVDSDYDKLACHPKLSKGAISTAKSLHKQAQDYCKKAFDWDTFESASTKLNDAADILELAQDICIDNMELAAKHCDFDTIIREDISVKAWNWIQNNVKGAF